jgi:hypothetical protein
VSTITVSVESEPHTEDLSGLLLNRPAPNGGSFMVAQRLPRDVWNAMKAAGASYWSADELEDMDMFDATPGWRYSGAAMEQLLTHGYTLTLRGETITTVEQFRALWTAEAKATYHARIVAEREASAAAEREKKIAAERHRLAKGEAYIAWKAEWLSGLICTTIAPPGGGFINKDTAWRHVITFDKTTPGAWHDTGDHWYTEEIDGITIYKCHYGNASKYYAPQAMVDAWTIQQDNGSVDYARHVLEYHGYGVYGSDVADRLVALRGLDHYIARARSEEWFVKAGNYHSRAVSVAAHYHIPMTPLSIAESKGDYSAFTATLRSVLGQQIVEVPNAPGEFWKRDYTALAQAADGRTFATTDRYNGGGWRPLTEDECAALDLDTAPPATPPTMPEADPLPTHDETAERSQRFSNMFTA